MLLLLGLCDVLPLIPPPPTHTLVLTALNILVAATKKKHFSSQRENDVTGERREDRDQRVHH